MRVYIITVAVFSFLMSCKSKKDQSPGVLSKAKMQAVMWDMVRSSEFLNGFVLFKDPSIDKTARSQKWHDKIFQMHSITKQEFEKSYAYYEQHPELMRDILDSLSRKQISTRPYQSTPVTPANVDSPKTLAMPGQDVKNLPRDSIIKRRLLRKDIKSQ